MTDWFRRRTRYWAWLHKAKGHRVTTTRLPVNYGIALTEFHCKDCGLDWRIHWA